MDPNNSEGAKQDVPQLLARLQTETDKLIRLADDINKHAITPQAKAGLERMANEINIALQILTVSLKPMYDLYETDLGMMNSKLLREANDNVSPVMDPNVPLRTEEYDENALWSDVSLTRD